MAKPSSLLSKIALLGISLAVVAGIAEAVSWWIWQQQVERVEAFKRQKEVDKLNPPPKGLWDDLPNLKGLYQVAEPGIRGTTAGVLFENNRHGFRGPERSFAKPANGFRVAVIGDSVTMGFGVLYEETYAGRIEEPLAARLPGRDVEVLNFGLSGLETRAVVRRFEELALRFDPDFVVYGFTLNDIEGPAYRHSFEGRDRTYKHSNESLFHTWRILGPKWVVLSDILFAPRGSYVHELRDNYFENPPAWQAVLAGFDRLRELADSRGFCTLMLIHTRLEALNALHPYHDFYAQIEAAAKARGFHPATTYDVFDGKLNTDYWITAFDAHPNGEGHGLLAEVLMREMERLPERCWEAG